MPAGGLHGQLSIGRATAVLVAEAAGAGGAAWAAGASVATVPRSVLPRASDTRALRRTTVFPFARRPVWPDACWLVCLANSAGPQDDRCRNHHLLSESRFPGIRIMGLGEVRQNHGPRQGSVWVW